MVSRDDLDVGGGGESVIHFVARRGAVAECQLRVAVSTWLLTVLGLISLWVAGGLRAAVLVPVQRIVARVVDVGRFPHQPFNRLLVRRRRQRSVRKPRLERPRL